MPIVGHFEFFGIKISRVHPPPKTHILFYSNGLANGLAIWHGLPNMGHVKVKKWPMGGHFKFDRVEIFQDAFSPETSHFVYSKCNDLAI